MVVTLDIAYFRAAYPQFSDAGALPDAVIERLWGEAEILVDNSAASPIPAREPSGNPRAAILYALLCHLAALATRGDVVGRVGGATQGSVNMSLAYGSVRNNPQWWQQTQCGARRGNFCAAGLSARCIFPGGARDG